MVGGHHPDSLGILQQTVDPEQVDYQCLLRHPTDLKVVEQLYLSGDRTCEPIARPLSYQSQYGKYTRDRQSANSFKVYVH